MSFISTFYLVPGETFHPPQNPRPSEILEAADITDIELSLIWCVLLNEEWNEDLLTELDFLDIDSDKNIILLPASLVELLSEITESQIADHASLLAVSEEFEVWEPLMVNQLLKDLSTLAKSAVEKNMNIIVEMD